MARNSWGVSLGHVIATATFGHTGFFFCSELNFHASVRFAGLFGSTFHGRFALASTFGGDGVPREVFFKDLLHTRRALFRKILVKRSRALIIGVSDQVNFAAF